MNYHDFTLTLTGAAGHYTVEAAGPGGISLDPVAFALARDEAFDLDVNRIQAGFAPTRAMMVRVGADLFDALFPRKIIRAFERAYNDLPDGEGLRLKLNVRPPELSDLPWELLYDPDEDKFLAARLSLPIVRFIESGRPAASLLARRPLRVLYVQANPAGTNTLDAGASEQAVRDALGQHGDVTAIRQATPAAVRDALRGVSYHVLHYDGHGAFDPAANTGYLYLHDAQGQTHKLNSETLAAYIDGTAARLVLFSACQTAADSSQKRFAGIAQHLMRTTGLPAAVAMQYDIPDASALAFTTDFYKALAADYPVDAAVVEGRKGILGQWPEDPFAMPDWATPVLYLRVADGDVLREKLKEDDNVDDEKETAGGESVDTGGGAYIRGNVNTGGGRFTGRDDHSINVGNVSGTGAFAIGHGARATHIQTGVGDETIRQAFNALHAALEKQPESAGKTVAAQAVEKLEEEAVKGEAADESKVEQWLRVLVTMLPDMAEVAIDTFINPVKGLSTIFRKVAQKARSET